MSELSIYYQVAQNGMTRDDLLRVLINQRKNTTSLLLGYDTRTSTTTTSNVLNHNSTAAIFFLNINSVPASGNVQMHIDAYNSTTGAFQSITSIAASPLITSTGLYLYHIGRGLATSPSALDANNTVWSACLPNEFRVRIQHSTTNAFAYSVAWHALP